MPAAAQPITAFDLIARPEAITPPWLLLGLFAAAGIVFACLAVAAWRLKWSRSARMELTPFAIGWCILVSYFTWIETDFAHATRANVREGRYNMLQGCLTSFHPGSAESSRTTEGQEVWTLGGERFAYGAGEAGFFWHRVEPLGGAVHADSHVQVAFVPNTANGGNAILRLIVTQHACPAAPDPGASG